MASVTSKEQPFLLPCPFCGAGVALEEGEETFDRVYGPRRWWGVICRSTINRGGSCAVQIRPSASIEAAVARWNMRNGVHHSTEEKQHG